MANKRNQNGGYRRGAVIYTPVAALLVLFIIIFGVSVFFRVTAIEVTGSARYTDDEIIAASGVTLGDNLFLLNSDAAARRITDAMPYVSAFSIERGIPDTAVLVVTESVALAAIQNGNDYWKVDSNGRLLERTDYAGSAGLIRVTGMTLKSPKEGTKAAVESSFETQLDYLLNVLTAIDKAGIGADVSALDITHISAITFVYKSTVTVRFGSGSDAAFKLERLFGALENYEAGFKGIVDVSKDDGTSVIQG